MAFAGNYPGRFVTWRDHTDTIAGLVENENEVFSEAAVFKEDLMLNSGWNMISSYIAPGVNAPAVLLAPIERSMVLI